MNLYHDSRAAWLCGLSYELLENSAHYFESSVHVHGPFHGCDVYIIEDTLNNWVVFRGTEVGDTFSLRDILTDLEAWRTQVPGNDFNLHSGMFEAWREVSDIVAEEVMTLQVRQKHEEGDSKPTIYCGHSLGGGMAGIAAATHRPAQLITFGAPRFGGAAVGEVLDTIEYHRWVNSADWCPRVPFGFGYRHAGECYFIKDDWELLVNPSRKVLALEFVKHFVHKWTLHNINAYKRAVFNCWQAKRKGTLLCDPLTP